MKQATGSNTPQSINKVSIQLTLDGHSFSAPALSGEFPGDGPVEVELLTPRTMLVPEELFDKEHAGEVLAAAGMAALPGECPVWSAPQQNAVAVMAAAENALAAVHERLGDRARYTTPLLCVPQASVPTVWMYYAAGLLYIKVYDGKLRFAEVVPAPDEADLLYMLERLGSEFRLRDYTLRIGSSDGRALKRKLGGYFSGKYKGRAINPPRNLRARPTTDFAKENLFNVLGNLLDFEECDVLDLFAGTGSISYEFASRGARSVTSVEINPVHYNFIRQTAAQLGIGNLYAVKANVFLYLKSCPKQFDVIFSDAPYDLAGSEQVVRLVLENDLLRPEGVLIFEHSKKMDFSAYPEFWQQRSYGSVQFSFFRKP